MANESNDYVKYDSNELCLFFFLRNINISHFQFCVCISQIFQFDVNDAEQSHFSIEKNSSRLIVVDLGIQGPHKNS